MTKRAVLPRSRGPQRNSVVRVPKTAELIAADLRRRIVRGELEEGENLPSELALSEEFGVSRPTMREAFRILETERLISVSRGSRGGATVHRPDIDVVARYAGVYLQSRNTSIADIFRARVLIEPPAVRLLAERRPAATVAQLRGLLARMEQEIEDPSAFAHNLAQVHLTIIEGTGNETLALLGQVLVNIIAAYLRALTRRYDLHKAIAAHRSMHELTDLIEAGDADAAERHLLRYLEASGEVTLKALGAKSILEVLY